MAKVIADITMSLDGYVAPPGADTADGVADVDELQAWVMDQDPVDTETLERATAATGAVVMGRRLFDIVDAPDVWTKDMAYGAQPAGTVPFFVVTHSPPTDVRLERELGLRFTFVDDLANAVDQARTAATDGDVVIMGGGDVIGQAIEAGLVDELHLHLAPMLLGGGTPLFRAGTRQMYRQRGVSPSSNAVHLIYERLVSAEHEAVGGSEAAIRVGTASTELTGALHAARTA
jgi:dihydrofolate reductase